MNGKKISISTLIYVYNYIYDKKEWIIDTHSNMDESQNNAEGKKSDTENYTVYSSIYESLKKDESDFCNDTKQTIGCLEPKWKWAFTGKRHRAL